MAVAQLYSARQRRSGGTAQGSKRPPLGLSAGVRTATAHTCGHLLKIHTARRPVHRDTRRGAALGAWLGDAWRGGPRHDETQERFGPFCTEMLGMTTWRCCGGEVRIGRVRFDGGDRRSAARRRTHRQKNKEVEMRDRGRQRSRWGDGVGVAGSAKTGSAVEGYTTVMSLLCFFSTATAYRRGSLKCPPVLWSSAAPASARRWQHGARLLLLLPPHSTTLPLSLPCGGENRK